MNDMKLVVIYYELLMIVINKIYQYLSYGNYIENIINLI